MDNFKIIIKIKIDNKIRPGEITKIKKLNNILRDISGLLIFKKCRDIISDFEIKAK